MRGVWCKERVAKRDGQKAQVKQKERKKDRQTERKRQKERNRQSERKTERQKERQRKRQKIQKELPTKRRNLMGEISVGTWVFTPAWTWTSAPRTGKYATTHTK